MFPITITLTLHDRAQLDALSALFPSNPAGNANAGLNAAAITATSVAGEQKVEAKKPAPAEQERPARGPRTAPEAAGAAQEKTASDSGPAAASAEAKPQASTAATTAPAIERKEVSDAIVKLAVKDKPRAIEILSKFGVKAGRELKEDQLEPCYVLVQEALGA